jgi:hypothetical protein
MRKRFLPAVACLLVSAALAGGQAPPAVPDPPAPAADPRETFWSLPPACPEPGCQERVWFSADYLLWWVRSGPLPAPLVTTGSPLDAVPGALGQGNTAVLFGGGPLGFGAFSGLRLGGGFDLGEGWALEGGYFGLERRAVGFTANSDPNGNPLIARPVFDNQAGVPGAYLDSLPDVLTGGVSVSARTRLQGYELNLAVALFDEPWLRIHLLTGFRTLELNEDLRITDNVMALVPGILTFLGGPAGPPSSLTVFDHFHNYNHFYGGQVGGRVYWRPSRFDVGVTGKLALGSTQRLALIDGLTTLNTPGASPVTNPGGILAQPTNSGRFFNQSFGVIPQLDLDVGWWLTPLVRLSVGYEFLYWGSLARPGNQIDTTVNPAQVPRDPNFGNGLGDARPAFQLHTSAFWAQGFHFGVLFQY